MKKALTIAAAVLMFAAVSTAPSAILAGPGCGQKGDIEAKLIGDKAAHCSTTDAAACSAKLGLSPEECKTLCASGEYTMVSMSIKGMTCGGCEGKVSASLEKIPGVIKVGTVSHTDESAFVLVDPKKINNDLLVSAVTDHGYEVKVIPAVARTIAASATTTVSADGKKSCSSAEKAACAKACASKTKGAKETKDATEGTN